MSKKFLENNKSERMNNDKVNTTSQSLSSSNIVNVLNIVASKRSDSYRLTSGAKRLLIMRQLQKDLSPRDLALLIRVLNEIDAAEDKANGGVTGTMSFGWIESQASDVEDAEETKIDKK